MIFLKYFVFSIMLFILLAYFIVIFIAVHKLLLKRIYYRWLINSLIYPVNLYRVRKMDISNIVQLIARFEINSYWFGKYWFGRSIKRQLHKRYENFLKEKGEI